MRRGSAEHESSRNYGGGGALSYGNFVKNAGGAFVSCLWHKVPPGRSSRARTEMKIVPRKQEKVWGLANQKETKSWFFGVAKKGKRKEGCTTVKFF